VAVNSSCIRRAAGSKVDAAAVAGRGGGGGGRQ